MTSLAHKVMANATKGVAIGAAVGLGAGVVISFTRGSDTKTSEDDVKERQYTGDILYLVNELQQFKTCYPSGFERMEVNLERLCALSDVAAKCTRDSVKPEWPTTAQHYNTVIRESLSGITVAASNDPQFGEGMIAELDERRDELIKIIDDLVFNITIQVRSLIAH